MRFWYAAMREWIDRDDTAKPDPNYVEQRRAAIERTLPEFPAPRPAAAQVASGSLVIVGGGGLPKEVVERFIELAGGPEAQIVVLPTATGDVLPPGNREGQVFERVGAKHVTVLKHRTKAEVESSEFVAALSAAKGVWFGGGRQGRTYYYEVRT